jgi:hypothetical protein
MCLRITAPFFASKWAGEVNEFYQQIFNPYLNFHRPCGVPEVVAEATGSAKGKVKRVYRWYATPWEILRRLPDLPRYLKDDLTPHDLERAARAKTDQAAAEQMQAAKRRLFNRIERRRSA